MPETTGLPCPECGAPRGADNSPACSCAERAAEALRDTRTAEAAAAEDFDPLRIRPYVELEGTAGAAAEQAAPAAPDATMTLRVVTPPAPDADSVSMFDPETPAGSGTGPDARPGAGPDARPGAGLDAAVGPEELPDRTDVTAGAGAPPRRSRRTALLVGSAAAVVAVVAGAAFASGVFSYDAPSRDGSAGDVRAGVPAASASVPGAASSSPDASVSASASRSADASPSTSESASPSASASESASAAASAPASGTPSPSATATGATASAQPQNGGGSGAVLRRGDSGPAVTELQLRLKQLYLFAGNADGRFDQQVEDSVSAFQWTRGLDKDPKGVYGAETRTALERETSRP